MWDPRVGSLLKSQRLSRGRSMRRGRVRAADPWAHRYARPQAKCPMSTTLHVRFAKDVMAVPELRAAVNVRPPSLMPVHRTTPQAARHRARTMQVAQYARTAPCADAVRPNVATAQDRI